MADTIAVEPALLEVVEMAVIDEFLVALDTKGDNYFHFFDLKSLEFLGSSIGKGQGPSEETFIYPYFMSTGKNEFLYQNNISIKTGRINKAGNSIEILKEIKFPSELANIDHTFMLMDNNVYGWDITRNSSREFVGFNTNDREIFEFGPEFPDTKKNIPKKKKALAFTKAITIKPDGNLFAAAYDVFPILRIYTKTGSLHKEVHFMNNQNFPATTINSTTPVAQVMKQMINYLKIKSTEKYIYGLYTGKTQGNFNRVGGLSNISNEIHVWDWSGNPIKKILLDKEIFSFVVDKKDSFLICHSLEHANTFFKYALNEKE